MASVGYTVNTGTVALVGATAKTVLNVIAPGAVSSASKPVLDVWTQKTITDPGGFVYLGLAEPFALGFQVWDVRNPDAPAQIWPVTPDTRQAVDLEADKIGGVAGHYAAAWTCDVLPAKKGRHQIRWFVTPVDGDDEQSFARDFDVLPAAASILGAGTAYALVSDLRDEGVQVGDANDARLLKLLGMQARYIERITERVFRPVYKVAVFDGSGGRSCQFGEPLIGLVSVSIGQPAITDVERSAFRVYNRHLANGMIEPDDRDDPRIEFAHGSDLLQGRRGGAVVGSPLFGVPWRDHWFPQTVLGVTVRGVWGFTDYDGSPTGMTPELIAHVQKLLVIREIPTMAGCGDREDARDRGKITSETTRDQSYTKKPEIETPFTGNREIDDILLMFKGPLRLGSA